GALAAAARGQQAGLEDLEVRLHAGVAHQQRRLDLVEAARLEEGADGVDDPLALEQRRDRLAALARAAPGRFGYPAAHYEEPVCRIHRPEPGQPGRGGALGRAAAAWRGADPQRVLDH